MNNSSYDSDELVENENENENERVLLLVAVAQRRKRCWQQRSEIAKKIETKSVDR